VGGASAKFTKAVPPIIERKKIGLCGLPKRRGNLKTTLLTRLAEHSMRVLQMVFRDSWPLEKKCSSRPGCKKQNPQPHPPTHPHPNGGHFPAWDHLSSRSTQERYLPEVFPKPNTGRKTVLISASEGNALGKCTWIQASFRTTRRKIRQALSQK